MSSVRCENGMWEWDVGMVFVVFSHLCKARAFARTLPKCPDPHSYISIERKFCSVANQMGIAILNWEMSFRSLCVCVGL